MPRRALLATMITGTVGALMGVFFGAIVGRVIALFGDETVQTSVPMIFCGTLGFFVGGSSTIKGSLERFGAKRAGIGTFAATVVLILLVGGASVTAQSGVIVGVSALVSLVLASVVAVGIGQPQNVPRHSLNAPRSAPAQRRAEASMARASERARASEPEGLGSAADPSPNRRPPAAQAARRVATATTAPAAADWQPEEAPADPTPEQLDDWSPEDEAGRTPPHEARRRPRREQPLSRASLAQRPEAAPAKKHRPVKTAPTSRGAAGTERAVPKSAASPPAKKTTSAAKKAAPARTTTSAAKKAAPARTTAPSAKAAPAKKAAAAAKGAGPVKKTSPPRVVAGKKAAANTAAAKKAAAKKAPARRSSQAR